MAKPTASIQLIVFGPRNQTDLEGVLKDLKTAGYPAFEAGNLFQTFGEQRSRKAVAESGLKLSGIHFGYGEFADSAKVGSHIAFCKAMGVKHIMCSGVSDSKTAQGYRDSAKQFNALGARLRDEGLVFNYHNHAWEFTDLGGLNGMDILAAETDPNLVKFNIDVYWVAFGDKNPVEFIHTHANRAGYFHFKDGRKSADGQPIFLELGRGDVDLKGSMEAALAVGAEWIVAEQDSTELPVLESVTISRNYMKEVLGC